MQCWWLCCIRCWGCGVMNTIENHLLHLNRGPGAKGDSRRRPRGKGGSPISPGRSSTGDARILWQFHEKITPFTPGSAAAVPVCPWALVQVEEMVFYSVHNPAPSTSNTTQSSTPHHLWHSTIMNTITYSMDWPMALSGCAWLSQGLSHRFLILLLSLLLLLNAAVNHSLPTTAFSFHLLKHFSR